MKQFISLTFFFTTFFFNSFGQDYQKEFNDFFTKNDTASQRILLQKWDTENNQDPDLYVAYFNYFVNRSKQEIIELSSNTEGKTYDDIRNSNKTRKDPIGFINGISIFNPYLIKKGFYYADKGIEIAPTRLDIRFGKIFIFSKMKDWSNFTEEIIKAIDYGANMENKWIWKDNKPLEEPKVFLFENIQTYQTLLYDTNDDGLLNYMKQIAETVLKYYPENVESLSNLSIVYITNNEYDKALIPLLKAAKIAPTDNTVLSNIAHAYKMKGDKTNAIVYYKLVQKYGDIDSSNYAQQQIVEVGK